jgi:subtilisin family serine protease
MNKAVNHAGSKGKLVVTAAGNDFSDLDHDGNFASVPAQSGSGISAWAGDIDGGLAVYSNHGRSGAWVGAGGGDNTPGSPQIPLPGCVLPAFGHDGIVSVCSTFSIFFSCGPTSVLFGGTGTSFSAPMVAGVAALVDGKAGGSLSGGQLKTILARTADDVGPNGVDNLFSHGRVNAGNAVMY